LSVYFEAIDTEQNARLFLTGAYTNKPTVFKFLYNEKTYDIYANFVVDKQRKTIRWMLKINLSEKNDKETVFLISLIKEAFKASSSYQSLFDEIIIVRTI